MFAQASKKYKVVKYHPSVPLQKYKKHPLVPINSCDPPTMVVAVVDLYIQLEMVYLPRSVILVIILLEEHTVFEHSA